MNICSLHLGLLAKLLFIYLQFCSMGATLEVSVVNLSRQKVIGAFLLTSDKLSELWLLPLLDNLHQAVTDDCRDFFFFKVWRVNKSATLWFVWWWLHGFRKWKFNQTRWRCHTFFKIISLPWCCELHLDIFFFKKWGNKLQRCICS